MRQNSPTEPTRGAAGWALSSRMLQQAVQRSEQRRAAVMLAGVGVLLSVMVFRNVTGGAVQQGITFILTVVTLLLLGAFEVGLLAAVRRADARSELLPPRLWTAVTIVESLAPTLLIIIVQVFSSVGAVDGATPPSMMFYGTVLALSVMHLRPALSLIAGVVGAGGHMAAVLVAGLHAAAAGESFSWPLMLSYGLLILITGAGAAVVSREFLSHVTAALVEATERQRIQIVARNTLIFGLAKLAEYRDSDTGSHLDRISAYCRILAEAMRDRFEFIDDAWIQTLCVASSMHDIGKVGIPDAVLCKPGRLTEDERLVIQRHPGLGARVLTEIHERQGNDALLEMSAQIAACHHERWDGTGYPAGLAGAEIPLAARIVSIADVYDALTSARVYKAAMPHTEAVALIVESGGKQFDPDLVGVFRSVAPRLDQARLAMADALVEAAPVAESAR